MQIQKIIPETEIEFEKDKDSEEVEQINGIRKIFTESGDPEVDSLYQRYLKGRLNVQPDFQRQFVWDKTKSSRLIESALLDIPIPIVYLSENKDGKENVIDGQQRLTSFFSFINGRFPDNSDFKLSGLNVFTDLNGKKFDQLSEEHQDKIITYKIRVIKFKKESDNDLQFEIFTRLNTGSIPLNDQELRNCIYRGRFNDLLIELSGDQDFKFLLGIARPDKRMMDRELVLRFAAFYFNSYLNYSAPVRKYLNETMEKYQNISSIDETKLRNAFKNSISILLSLLDKNSFKRFYSGDEKNKSGRWEDKKFNVSLYDILMYSFAREDNNIVQQNLDRIREALIDLMTSDQEFIDSIELSTSSKRAVTIRFDIWRVTLQSIIGVDSKEPRCFSYSLKKELFEKNDICTICGNRILNIDDAAVDHIKQYWTGGKTIPENARLTHRFCNNSRARIETSDKPSFFENEVAIANELINTVPEQKISQSIKKPIDQKKYSFFEMFLNESKKKTHLFSKMSPQGYQSWLSTGAGRTGMVWVVTISTASARIDFCLNSALSDLNRGRLDFLLAKRKEIEDSFGESIEWENGNRTQPLIRSYSRLGGLKDDQNWENIITDLVDRLIRFERAIGPYLKEI